MNVGAKVLMNAGTDDATEDSDIFGIETVSESGKKESNDIVDIGGLLMILMTLEVCWVFD